MNAVARLPIGVALLLAACAPSFSLQTPAGFVELTEDATDETFQYRATTADGLVLAARELEHAPRGSLEFWTKAIENEIRHRGGYALLDDQPVKTSAGLSGRRLRFGHDEGRQPHLYYVAVFVTDDHLYVLEVGGRRELVEAHEAQLEAAMASLSAD